MATQLFVNIAASSVSQALVRSRTDMNPVDFPQLVLGDGRTYEIYFVDGQGGFASFSGDGAFIPYLAIGSCGYPSGGTAIWTFNGQSTSALAYNISPADLQTALQALSSIGSGNCLVAGTAGEYYTITFTGALAGAPQPEITVDFSGLTPASTVEINTIVEGDTGVNEVQLATLAENPLTFADNWTPITNGWTGTLSTATLEMIQAFSAGGGSLSETFQVTVADGSGVRTTYVKAAVSILCTIIDPEAFAGAEKPLLATQAALNAAVLGLGNFTREALSSSGAGNTNVTRPSTSRHHWARVSFTGSASTRTVSLLTTNTPNPGDTILLVLLPDATAGNIIEVRNATSGGTLLATVVTNATSEPYLLLFDYTGSAWELNYDQSVMLSKAGNLAGLANTVTAKANLQTLFSVISDKSASFTILESEQGTLFRCNTSGGSIVATLPLATDVDSGFMVAIRKQDASAQIVTTDPATQTLANAGATMILQSDGTSWSIVMLYNPVAVSPSIQQVVQNAYPITGLVGGSSTDLDGQPTAGGAIAVNSSLFISYGTPLVGDIWELVVGTDAASDIVVRPTDFNETTNPQVWKLKLRGLMVGEAAGSLLYSNGTTFVALPIGTAGQALVVNGTADGVEWGTVEQPDVTEIVDETMTSGDTELVTVNPVTSSTIVVDGAARTSALKLMAPVDAYDGWTFEIRLEMPDTAGIFIEITDDATSTVLYTIASDDGGGSPHNEFVKVRWNQRDGLWQKVFNLSPVI